MSCYFDQEVSSTAEVWADSLGVSQLQSINLSKVGSDPGASWQIHCKRKAMKN